MLRIPSSSWLNAQSDSSCQNKEYRCCPALICFHTIIRKQLASSLILLDETSCVQHHHSIILLTILTAQFGSWNYGPQHGFARIIRWHVEKPPERLPSGDIEAIFCIVDNEITRSTWNYQYITTFLVRKTAVGLLMICVASGSDCRIDLSSGKRSFTLTLASTIRAKMSHSRSIFCFTLTSKFQTWGGVKSPVFKAAHLSTRSS